jgi:thiosulfate/3-mercaptopyruvate sulfurtransferase
MTRPLISVTELRDSLDLVTVLDVRDRMGGPPGRDEFAAGHVPGAAYVDLDDDLAAEPGTGGRHPLPDPLLLEAAMERSGVRNDRPVVVYDDWAGRAAARCWWLLRWAGHPDVRVLDGGWSAWQAAGFATEVGDAAPEPGDFTVEPGRMPVLPRQQVLDAARDGVVVDARAPERFRGETEPIDPVAGHVPGAVNVPTEANLADDGRFRSPGELLAAYAAVGAVPGEEVAVYCGSGVTACHDILALEVAGIPARLYPGSWSDWVADPSRPVETG